MLTVILFTAYAAAVFAAFSYAGSKLLTWWEKPGDDDRYAYLCDEE
jgi:hypothetical protein